jgi:hypothetical protein
MLLIERNLKIFFDRCESVRPQIIGSKKNRRRTSPVNSRLIDRLIPEETGAVYIIHGVNLNSNHLRHAHRTGLYKRHTAKGSLYCVEVSDDERRVRGQLHQFYYVLSGLGLGGCEILLSEEDLDGFVITEKNENSISHIKSTSLEFTLLNISNDGIKFNDNAIIGKWLNPDFVSDDDADFKLDGNPVITVMKTLDGCDFIRVRPPELLVAIRDSLESSSLVLNGNYEKYMARLSLVQR